MMMIKVMVTGMILVDDGDLWSMMLAMTYFGLIYVSDNQKYLHNIVLDLFPFASDTSV